MASPPRFVFVLADPNKTLALKGLVRQGIDAIGLHGQENGLSIKYFVHCEVTSLPIVK